jgi:hypothetical protein
MMAIERRIKTTHACISNSTAGIWNQDLHIDEVVAALLAWQSACAFTLD